MRIIKIKRENQLSEFTLTDNLYKELREFSSKHHIKISNVVESAVSVMASTLSVCEENGYGEVIDDIKKRFAVSEFVYRNSLKKNIPFDYEMYKDSIEAIKWIIGIGDDWTAVAFATIVFIEETRDVREV